VTPGPRIQATLANTVIYLDGVPQTEAGAEPSARRPGWLTSARVA
jgi:hypothetical protein